MSARRSPWIRAETSEEAREAFFALLDRHAKGRRFPARQRVTIMRVRRAYPAATRTWEITYQTGVQGRVQ